MSASLPLPLRTYRRLTSMSAPVLETLLRVRMNRGKEDPARGAERRGQGTRPRPPGFLVWIHAVSVGEANSVLPLIAALLARNEQIHILLTTNTTTSARLMAERLPESRTIHQFVPLDHPLWTGRFLDHWRPDLALITESELWPNLLLGAEAREIPLILLNARLSARSAANWQRVPKTIARLLRCFSLCLAQDAATAGRLRALGAWHIETPGNLKYASPPLPDRPDARLALDAQLGARPRWLAASTHPGEEALIADVHDRLKAEIPDLLTVIVPRHPDRGPAIADDLRAQGLTIRQRSIGEPIDPTTDIYLGDTLGELGLFYRLAPITVMGGTFAPVGGQNPLEPARLGCAILHGPSTANFAEIFLYLAAAKATEEVGEAAGLAAALSRLLGDHATCRARGEAARAAASAMGGVLERVLDCLEGYLPRATQAADARA